MALMLNDCQKRLQFESLFCVCVCRNDLTWQFYMLVHFSFSMRVVKIIFRHSLFSSALVFFFFFEVWF